jgi:hypothetical protein
MEEQFEMRRALCAHRNLYIGMGYLKPKTSFRIGRMIAGRTGLR